MLRSVAEGASTNCNGLFTSLFLPMEGVDGWLTGQDAPSKTDTEVIYVPRMEKPH